MSRRKNPRTTRRKQAAFHDRLVRTGSYATEPDPAAPAKRGNLCPIGHPVCLEKHFGTWTLHCATCKMFRLGTTWTSTA